MDVVLPLIQVPLKRFHFNPLPLTSDRVRRRPLNRAPSSSGDNRNIENTINPKTAAMTKRAMKMPLQFRWPGDEATSSWNEIWDFV